MADDIDLREALDAAISAVDSHEPTLHASVAALGVALQAAAPLLIEQGRRQVFAEILSHDDGGHDWSVPDVVLLARDGEAAVDQADERTCTKPRCRHETDETGLYCEDCHTVHHSECECRAGIITCPACGHEFYDDEED